MSTEAPAKPPKPEPAPMFIIGADDRPADNRIVARTIALRGDIKAGDREFSSPVLAHEVIALRHHHESRTGSGQIRVSASWPPGLPRERGLTHSDLAAEVKRMRETFLSPRQNGQVIKSFEIYFGAEPTEQLKRLHEVMRLQYAAWSELVDKAVKRIEGDTSKLHPEVVKSMAYDLITEREVETVLALADPSRAGLKEIELAEVKPADIALAAAAVKQDLDAVKAAAEKEVDETELTPGERIADKLGASGLDSQRAMAVGALVENAGGEPSKVSDEDLIRVLGSKQKAEQIRKLMV